MNQLPLIFKLYKNKVLVGYEQHHGKGIMQIWHSPDGDTWKCINDSLDNYIDHDEKMQATGFNDKTHYPIFFGDQVRQENGTTYTVEFNYDNGQIIGKANDYFVTGLHNCLFPKVEVIK